jgi:hypothetical protein
MPLARFCRVEFSWPFMLCAVGALVAASLLMVWGVRVLARTDRDEEAASRVGVELAAALAREPGLRHAQILPVATIPIEARPSVELTGRVPSTQTRDLALAIVRRELERLRPGMLVIDRLEIVPPAPVRRSA